MSKQSAMFICQNCGWQSPRWAGQCGSCSSWNSLIEEVQTSSSKRSPSKVEASATSFNHIEAWHNGERLSTTIHELDRVLGGDVKSGLVPGEVILLGGEPGIGKSTLLTQVAMGMITNSTQKNKNKDDVVYVAGEESPQQVGLRIRRLLANRPNNKEQTNNETWTAKLEQLKFITTTDVDQIVSYLAKQPPKLVIVDSIQTLITQDLSGSAGSIGQVREVTDRLIGVAKSHHIPIFLVGHVTKDGKLAGPMVLEHLVDAVLELKGDKTSELRILRSLKNRFGATDEVGVFRMTDEGYQEVSNPSEYFLETRENSEPGSAVSCVVEGTRPLLIEVQALVIPTYLPQPRRIGRGISANRLQILTAVLEKHAKIPLSRYDVFVSLAGGYESREPSLDLAICAALASSYADQPTPKGSVFIGEVGLLGEVRTAPLLARREKEATRLGYTSVYSRKQTKTIAQVLSVVLVTKTLRAKK